MSRTVPKLSSIGRAYAAGRVAQLRPPSPINQHRIQERLAQASPEISAAYAAGQAADPAGPMPGQGQLLAQVVREIAAD